MIDTVRVTEGYAMSLPKTEFQLAPKKVNVLFGDNGSGKSTLLKLIAAHCLCPEDGGWTRIHTPEPDEDLVERMRLSSGGEYTIEHLLKALRPGDSKADVVWDGSPTLWDPSTTEAPDSQSVGYDVRKIAERLTPRSSGERRISHLDSWLSDALKPYTGVRDPRDPMRVVPSLKRNWKVAPQIEWIGQAREKWAGAVKHRRTILLDEPERSLALPISFNLWDRILLDLNRDNQVIISTHSPLALSKLGHPDFQFIETTPGYLYLCEQGRRIFEAATAA